MWAARVIAAFVIAMSTVAAAVAEDQMPWLPSVEAAQQVAARTNRLVLIHFWAPWCQPCMRLEREVFSKPETGKALEPNFVLVKLNTDEAPGTARLYGVSSLPSDVIISANGRLVSQLQSPPTAQQYIVQLNQAAAGYRQLTARPTQHAAVTPVSANPAAAQPVVAMPQAAPIVPPPAPPATAIGTPGQPSMAPAQGVAISPPQAAPVSPEHAATQAPAGDATASAQPPIARAPGAQTPVGGQATVDRYAEYFPPGSPPQAGSPQTTVAPVGAPQSPVAAQTPAASVAPSVPGTAAAPQQGAYNSYVSYSQQQPPAPQLPPGCPPLGLDGNCPVTLVERMQWALGDRAWGAVHRGRTYLFAGPEERARFLASPDLYSPVMSGIDPVLALDNQMVVAGKREFGVFGADRRIYLFADEASLKRFEQNPKRYAAEAVQAQR
jgi:thiol-disulfide isomerase/thioredoxin/YHS domain-containing protein